MPLLRWIDWILSYGALRTHLGDGVPSEKTNSMCCSYTAFLGQQIRQITRFFVTTVPSAFPGNQKGTQTGLLAVAFGTIQPSMTLA